MKWITYRFLPRMVAIVKSRLTRKNLESIARFILAFAGGALVAWGIAARKIDVETAKLILNWVITTSGIDIPAVLVTTIGPLIWAALKNRRDEKHLAAALELPEGSTHDELAARLKDGVG